MAFRVTIPFLQLKFSRNICCRSLIYSTLRISKDHNSLIFKDKILLRAYSSSDSTGANSENESEDKPVKSFGRRFLNALKLLALGSKRTVSDAKKMFALRREATKSGLNLLSGKAPPSEDVTITRAELSFIIQVSSSQGVLLMSQFSHQMCVIFVVGPQRFVKMSPSCHSVFHSIHRISCCATVSA